jgi:hypothetical protein
VVGAIKVARLPTSRTNITGKTRLRRDGGREELEGGTEREKEGGWWGRCIVIRIKTSLSGSLTSALALIHEHVAITHEQAHGPKEFVTSLSETGSQATGALLILRQIASICLLGRGQVLEEAA